VPRWLLRPGGVVPLHTYQGLLTHLATLTRNDLRYGTNGPTVPTLAEPTPVQRRAFHSSAHPSKPPSTDPNGAAGDRTHLTPQPETAKIELTRGRENRKLLPTRPELDRNPGGLETGSDGFPQCGVPGDLDQGAALDGVAAVKIVGRRLHQGVPGAAAGRAAGEHRVLAVARPVSDPAQRGGVTDLVKVVPRVAATFIKVASPVWADRIHPPSGSEVRLRNQAVETLIMAELQARSANEIGWSGGHQLSLARPKSVG